MNDLVARCFLLCHEPERWQLRVTFVHPPWLLWVQPFIQIKKFAQTMMKKENKYVHRKILWATLILMGRLKSEALNVLQVKHKSSGTTFCVCC